jgi:putative SOS response-associated peptidase YedK
MPAPPQFSGAPIANIRNVKSSHWRGCLKPQQRCEVPFSVSTGVRGTKKKPLDGEHQLLGFLTTEANAEVGRIHPKTMPVIHAPKRKPKLG